MSVRNCALGCLTMLLLTVGTAYGVFMYTPAPLSLILRALPTDNVTITGAGGSLAGGYSIDECSFKAPGTGQEAFRLEGCGIRYPGLLQFFGEGPIVIDTLSVDKVSIHADGSEPNTNSKSSGSSSPNEETAEGSPPRPILIGQIRISDISISNPEAVLNVGNIELQGVEMRGASASLETLKIEGWQWEEAGFASLRDGRLKMESLETAQGAVRLGRLHVQGVVTPPGKADIPLELKLAGLRIDEESSQLASLAGGAEGVLDVAWDGHDHAFRCTVATSATTELRRPLVLKGHIGAEKALLDVSVWDGVVSSELHVEDWTFRAKGFRPADYLARGAPIELTGCLTMDRENTWFENAPGEILPPVGAPFVIEARRTEVPKGETFRPAFVGVRQDGERRLECRYLIGDQGHKLEIRSDPPMPPKEAAAQALFGDRSRLDDVERLIVNDILVLPAESAVPAE